MKICIKSNLFGGIFATILAMALWITIPYQIVDISNSRVSSQFVPRLLAVIILIAGISLIVKSILKEDKKIEVDLRKEAKVIGFILCLIVYTKLMETIGFVASSILLEIVTLVILKTKKISYYITAIILVIIMYLVFKYVLYVPLP